MTAYQQEQLPGLTGFCSVGHDRVEFASGADLERHYKDVKHPAAAYKGHGFKPTPLPARSAAAPSRGLGCRLTTAPLNADEREWLGKTVQLFDTKSRQYLNGTVWSLAPGRGHVWVLLDLPNGARSADRLHQASTDALSVVGDYVEYIPGPADLMESR